MAQFRKDTHQYLKDGTTIFEVVMLADQYGNLVGPANPSGAAVDAFGRARVSNPVTLFDSFHRFADNGKFATSNNAGGSHSFVSNTATIDCTVNTTSGSYVYRETKRVFSYQPGKSLQILKTFVMNPAKAGLRQRAGYFDNENGFFIERSGTNTVQFVKRSKVTGVVVDTPVPQSQWNLDPLDGTGPSLLTLNLDNPQILFMDIEWLGVGSVRMGFVINGQPIVCHTFHHANLNSSPKGAYIQTACLPIRAEIENTAGTSSNSTLKLICTSVISEGGYELQGMPKSFGIEPTAANQFRLTTAGTYYPVLSFRLHPDRLNAVVIPKDIDIVPINNGVYRYKILYNPTLTGAVWANTDGANASLQYNTNTAATVSGGFEFKSGYLTATTQASSEFNLGDGGSFFMYQFERDSFANTAIPLVLAITSDTATANVVATMSWEEITN